MQILLKSYAALISALQHRQPDQEGALDGEYWHNWVCCHIDVLMLARFGSYMDVGTFVDNLLAEDVVTACAIVDHLRCGSQRAIQGKCDIRDVIREVNARAKLSDGSDACKSANALLRWARKVQVSMDVRDRLIVSGC